MQTQARGNGHHELLNRGELKALCMKPSTRCKELLYKQKPDHRSSLPQNRRVEIEFPLVWKLNIPRHFYMGDGLRYLLHNIGELALCSTVFPAKFAPLVLAAFSTSCTDLSRSENCNGRQTFDEAEKQGGDLH
jgi:hypothetical protein